MQPTLAIGRWTRSIPAALILAGAGAMVLGLAMDYVNESALSGIGPRQVSLMLSGLAFLLAGIVLTAPAGKRSIAEWLLVATAVAAVVFAADLVVINGLPDVWSKLVVFASVAIAILLSLTPASTTGEIWLELAAGSSRVTLEKQQLGQILRTTVELGLLVVLAQQLNLESQAFYHNLMLLVFFGFVVHYLLPSRYRLPFFLLISLAAIAGILGLANGAWTIAIGLGLIAICHLPVAYTARIIMLLLAGVLLVAFRANWIAAPALAVIWPVLASMFMFRLIIYVHDLKRSKTAPELTTTLSYFFLLPNVVFPFFPIVDFATFRRTYYDDDQFRIYQKGVQWIVRGVLQLILYRFINYYLVIAPQDVADTSDLIRYLIANFALYVRISGQFHLIIGLLHLFGFNLPPTHVLYFLATSFTDLWRRINIYWKDFMQKVFFYPAYFRVKHWGPTTGLVIATSIVFFLTWFFHAYQWFWLRGSFLLTAQDILFWSILAVLVIANTLYEMKRGRRLEPSSMRETAGLALRAAGTFSVMAILWALWGSASIQDWLSLFSVVQPALADVSLLLLGFLGMTSVFGFAIWMTSSPANRAGRAIAMPRIGAGIFTPANLLAGSLVLLVFASNPAFYSRLGGRTGEVLADLTTDRLSDEEAALLQRGYYEDLTGVNRFNSELWELYTKRPADWPTLTETEAARYTGDNFIVELAPSKSIIFHGARLSTNQWGMRDRDYQQIPPPGVYRIALTGPSFAMGFGVADDEVFEAVLEDKLNRQHAGDEYAGYEILNFAVPGYSAIQNGMLVEQKALSFRPDALFFIAHQREAESVVLYLADRMAAGADLPYKELVALARRAGVEAGMSKTEAVRRLSPYATEIVSWAFGHIADISREHGVQPVWIFMPTLEYPRDEEEIARLSGIAEESGFIVLDLSPAYAGQEPDSLIVAYWDKHPNARAHALIADQLYRTLSEMGTIIPLGEPTSAEIR